MNENARHEPAPTEVKGGLRWPQVLLIIVATVIVTSLLTIWLIKTFVFPSDFEPVQLSQREEQVLDAKLQRLDALQFGSVEGEIVDGKLTPEVYSEDPQKRTITFSERELNALLAKNTDLADKVAVDLADKLVSAKILVPMDADFPILGGRVLRIKTGVVFDYQDSRPVVKLRGVSLMGVPIPNAWLGGLKNVDLVAEFGGDQGFWKSFADGLENIQMEEGQLLLKLKE